MERVEYERMYYIVCRNSAPVLISWDTPDTVFEGGGNLTAMVTCSSNKYAHIRFTTYGISAGVNELSVFMRDGKLYTR